MTENALLDFGLNKTEVAVYLALLSIGSAPASILGRRSGISRTNARHACQKLEAMGLIAVRREKNTLIFTPEPLEKISYLLNQERKQLEKKEERMKLVVNQLKALMNPDIVQDQLVRFYQGFEGVKRVYEDTISENQPICGFEDYNTMSQEIEDYILYEYIPRRVEKGIFGKVINPSSAINKKYRKEDRKCLRETKFLPADVFPMEVEINMYGNKTAFFSYKKGEMFGAIIESSAVTNSLKAIFNICWKLAKDH